MANQVFALYEGKRTELIPNMSVYSDGKKYVCGEWEQTFYNNEDGERLFGHIFKVFPAEGDTVTWWEHEVLLPDEEVFCDKAPEMAVPENGWHYPEDPADLVEHAPLEVGEYNPQKMDEAAYLASEPKEKEEPKELTKEEKLQNASDFEVNRRNELRASRMKQYEEEVSDAKAQDLVHNNLLDSILNEEGVDEEDLTEEEKNDPALLDFVATYKNAPVDKEPSVPTESSSLKEKREHLDKIAKREALRNKMRQLRDKQVIPNTPNQPEESRKILSETDVKALAKECYLDEVKHEQGLWRERLAEARVVWEKERGNEDIERKLINFQRRSGEGQGTGNFAPLSAPVTLEQATQVQETKAAVSSEAKLNSDAINLIQSLSMDTIVAIKNLDMNAVIQNAELVSQVISLSGTQKSAISSLMKEMA